MLHPSPAATIPRDDDRRDLVRAFTAWTGDPAAADDLAQETLLAAWTSRRQPEAAEEWRPWLFGVARNVLLRWRRERAKHGQRVATAPESAWHLLAAADDGDLDARLDHRDIVDLLDTALSRLPAETRQALLLRYIDELPQAEIAARLGVHEKALEGRLHRGKRAMHRHLLTERPDSAVALGLVAEPDTWVETGIWCPVCGERRLHGRWFDCGDLRLDCLSCDNWMNPGERSYFFSSGNGHQGMGLPWPSDRRPSYRIAMERVSLGYHRLQTGGIDGHADCPGCGGTVRPRAIPYDGLDTPGPDIRYECDRCGYCLGQSYLPGSGYLHPAIRAWNDRNARIRMLRPREIEVSGRPSVMTIWESVSGTGSAVTIHDFASLRMVRAICDGVAVLEADPA